MSPSEQQRGRRKFLGAVGGGLLAALSSPIATLDALAQTAESRDLVASAEPINPTQVYTLFKSSREPLESKLSAAEMYSEQDPQAFLQVLDTYSTKRRDSSAVGLLVNYSLNEDVCHMRHLAGYFSLRANKRETLRQLTQTAINTNQNFFQRVYAIELMGLSCEKSTIDPLLDLLYDLDPFIGAEAAMALEKTVLAGSKRDKFEIQRKMYRAMLQQENECKDYPIRRNHIAWAYRDLFGAPKQDDLVKSLRSKKIKKDNANMVATEITEAINSEGRWTFDRSKGLDAVYQTWKRKNKNGRNPEDHITITTQGVDPNLRNTFLERVNFLKTNAPKAHHFFTNFSDNVVLSTKSDMDGHEARSNARLNIIQISENLLKPQKREFATLLMYFAHEPRHLYTSVLGDKKGENRGEEKSARAEKSVKNFFNSPVIDSNYYHFVTGNNIPKTDEESWKGVITHILKEKHWK